VKHTKKHGCGDLRLRVRGCQTAQRDGGLAGLRAGVIADTRELQREAWRQVAEEEGLPFPQTERQLYDLRPERAITEVLPAHLGFCRTGCLARETALRCALFLSGCGTAGECGERCRSIPRQYALSSLGQRLTGGGVRPRQVLQWTREWGVAQRLAWRVAAVYSELFHTLSEPRPGVREWLAALQRASVPCALVTSFDRRVLSRCPCCVLRTTCGTPSTGSPCEGTRAGRNVASVVVCWRGPTARSLCWAPVRQGPSLAQPCLLALFFCRLPSVCDEQRRAVGDPDLKAVQYVSAVRRTCC